MLGTCLKCKREDVEVFVARKETYCHDCYLIFAKSKYRRAIDAFRLELTPGNANLKLILSFSGGVSSTVLVDLVYTSVQRTRGRYHMPIILHINEAEFQTEDREQIAHSITYVKAKYPDMVFLERSMGEVDKYINSSVDLAAQDDLIVRTGSLEKTPTASLRECISALPSKTSQEDVLALYREHLIRETAREQGCSGILFGNSATSLAAKTLSLTAKGRGYALPWETADHSLSHSGIWCIRPMKGLMLSEVHTYAKLLGMPISEAVTKFSGKSNSIDELTQRYFSTLEEQFPSLVATVVRTTNKLVEPVPRDQALGDCKICGMTYQEGARQWLSDITVSQAAPSEGQEPVHAVPLVKQEDFCYGCVVATRGIKKDLMWPAFKIVERDNSVQSVLAEFQLED